MAIPSESTALVTNRPWVQPAVYPGGFIDQFIRKIAFERLDAPTSQFTFNRAASIPIPVPFDQDVALTVAAMNTTDLQLLLVRIGDTALVDYFQQTAFSNTNDVLQTQIEAKKIGLIRALGSQIVAGSGTPPVAGLADQSPQSMVVTGNALPTLEDLHRLVNTVRSSDGWVGGGADCIMANERTIRYIMRLLEQAAGGNNVYIWDPDLGTAVPQFQGIPIYIGQVPGTGANENHIWALKLTGATGIRVVHCPGSSEDFGIEVLPLPMQTGKSQFGAFVGGYYALFIPESQSTARLTGTTTAQLQAVGILALP